MPLGHDGRHTSVVESLANLDITSHIEALDCKLDVSVCSKALVAYNFLSVTPTAYLAIRDDEAELRRIVGKFAAFDVTIDPHNALRLMLIIPRLRS